MSTWKKYGGIDKFDKTNHMTVDSMVTNYFTIRKQIIGDIDISGNLAVRTRLDVYDDVSFNKDITVSGSVDIGDILDVSGNITTNANLSVKKDILVYNNLYFNSDRKVFMNGTPDGIGVNTTMPISQFDITSELESVFSVKTSQPTTENVIARNNVDKGIVVKSDLSSATIDFFCDGSMVSVSQPYTDENGRPQLDVQLNYNNYDARIQAVNDGSLTIDACSNIQLLAETIITDNTSSILNNNSSLSVYNDKTTDVYLEDVYDNSASYVSDGISLVSVDESSSIFMKMVSRTSDSTSKGFALVGGAFPGDTSRAMGSLGCLDSDGNYTPTQTIVSGNSNVKIKTTVGINKYAPEVDNRVLDINGPVRINNGEITTVQNADFQCNFISFCRDNVNCGISTGAPFTSYTDPDNKTDLNYWEAKIYYTSDAGMTWSNSSAKVYGTTTALPLNAGFVYDSSYAFVFGNDGAGFYTNDGGATWMSKSFNATSTNVESLYIAKGVGTADCRFFMTYDGLSLRYYDAKIGSTDSNYVSYNGSSGSIILTNESTYTINSLDISGGANVVHGYGTQIYCAGSSIYKYDASSSLTIDNYINQYTPSSSSYSFNTIYAYDDNYVVAAGENIIAYTLDGGTVWNDIIFTTSDGNDVDVIHTENNESFQSIHVYDGSNAIVVGTNSSMYYTNNGTLWKKVPDNLLDAAGNRSICYGDSNVSLNGIFCVDKNSFITSRIVEDYVDVTDNGSSKIFYNYFPNLFNRTQNMVLDMCGNMNIYGDINIQDNGNITSNGTTFYLVNNSVQDIYFGGDASMIEIGNSSGSTTIHHDLYVDKDLTVVDGNVYVPNTAYINIADISGLIVHEDVSIDSTLTIGNRVIIENDASITVNDTTGAPLYVTGGGYFGGNVIMSNNNGDSLLYVNGDTRIIGELYAMNNVYIESYNTTDEYAVQVKRGNVYLNNNMDISGNLEVMGNFLSRNNNYLGGNTYITGNVIYSDMSISLNNVTIDDISLNAATIGLGNVDNTSDLDKPISNATRTYVDNFKAPIDSPSFTGNPTTPSITNLDDDSTRIATTSFVKSQNYLKTSIAESAYARINSPELSGTPTAPTAELSTNTNQIATTAFVKSVASTIPTYLTSDNSWGGNNNFNNDLYVHGTRFGTIDGNSIVIGNNSLSSITTGTNNIAVGAYNGYNITSGSNNTIIGYQSLYSNNTGGNNIAIGYNAGYSDSSGSYNTYIGTNTDTDGNYTFSTAIGYGATISANNQIVLGTNYEYVSVPSTTTSTSINTGALVVKGGVGIAGNIYVNRNADVAGNTTIRGNVNSTSTSTGALIVSNGGAGIAGNIHIGKNAYIYGNIYTPTASSSEDSSMVATTAFVKTAINNDQASNHTWTGTNRFSQNITVNDTVVGKYSTNNYVFGNAIMPSIENAENNIAVGSNSLNTNYSGSNNIAIGNNAMYDLYDNNYNTAVGHYALATVGGGNNTALGYYAGTNNDTGIYNTYIGANTSSNGGYSYSSAIGYGATITASNEIVLGTANEFVFIPGTTTSYDNMSGALVVSGGVGIGGDVHVGGNLYSTTANQGENSTKVATTAFVQSAVSAVSLNTSSDYQWYGSNTWNGSSVFSTNIKVNTMDIGYDDSTKNYFFGKYVSPMAEGDHNFGIGDSVLRNCINGVFNMGIGYDVLYDCVTGNSNIGIGSQTLYSCNGTFNLGIGTETLRACAYGINNTAIGHYALPLTCGENSQSGSHNTSVGCDSGLNNITGSYNTFLGVSTATLANGNNYSYSTAIGQSSTITDNHQVVLGTNGEYVYIPGYKSSNSKTEGALVVSGGVGIGGDMRLGGFIYLDNSIDPADNSNMVATTSYVKTALNSISSVSTSGTNTWSGINIFTQAIQAQSDITMTGNINNVEIKYFGNGNFKLGQYSLSSITTGAQNTAVGQNVLGLCTSGRENTGIGLEALLNCTTGNYNIAVGLHALQECITGSSNVAVGYGALQLDTGDNNTAIGSASGAFNRSGSNNTFIGNYTQNNYNDNYSYSTALGAQATLTDNHQVVLGTADEYVYIPGTKISTGINNGALVVKGGVGITGNCYALAHLTSSDYRIKENIIQLDGNFTVDNLNPVHYYNKLTDCSDIGFLAHEVQQEYPYLVHGEKDGNDYQSLNYTGMIGILVNEIKVLKQENTMMKEELHQIKNLLYDMSGGK